MYLFCLDMAIGNYSPSFDAEIGLWWTRNCLLWVLYLNGWNKKLYTTRTYTGGGVSMKMSIKFDSFFDYLVHPLRSIWTWGCTSQGNNHALRKKWSQNGASGEPFWKTAPLWQRGAIFDLFFVRKRCLRGAKMVPLFLKWHRFQPFFEKRLLMGSIFEDGSSLSGGTVFLLNMIMKEKMAPLCQRGAIFKNGSSEAPFWLHFFSEWGNAKSGEYCVY